MKKILISVNIYYLLFLRDICEGKLTLEEADNERSKIIHELKAIDRCKIDWKKIFSKQRMIIHWCKKKSSLLL